MTTAELNKANQIAEKIDLTEQTLRFVEQSKIPELKLCRRNFENAEMQTMEITDFPRAKIKQVLVNFYKGELAYHQKRFELFGKTDQLENITEAKLEIPFGDDWEREMMKLTKKDIVTILRGKLIELNNLK